MIDILQDLNRSADVHVAHLPVREVLDPNVDRTAQWEVSVPGQVRFSRLQVKL